MCVGGSGNRIHVTGKWKETTRTISHSTEMVQVRTGVGERSACFYTSVQRKSIRFFVIT